VVVELPRAIDVRAFGLDAAARCGPVGRGAALRGFEIETSPTGADGSWTLADAGELAAGDQDRFLVRAPRAGTSAVRFVRLTALSAQDAVSSDFLGVSELEVYGTATPDPEPTAPEPEPEPTTTTSGEPTPAPAPAPAPGPAPGPGPGPAPPAPPLVGPPSPAPTPGPAVRPARPALTAARTGTRGRVALTVSCSARCTLAGTLARGRRTVGRVTRKLDAGGRRRVTLALSSRERARLRRAGARGVRVILRANVRDAAGQRRDVTRRVTVRL